MAFEVNDFSKKLYLEVGQMSQNGRASSSNFLIWFLINYFRIDSDYSLDLVCDHPNDKGIDGIYVDDETEEVYVFQSKFRESFEKSEGDGDLRKLVGSGEWIAEGNLDLLDQSKASKELKDLILREKVQEAIGRGYSVKLLFVTTGYFNSQAKEYIEVTKEKVDYWDCHKLFDNYTFSGKEDFVIDEINLKPANGVLEYEYDHQSKAYLLIVSATDLLKLNGIVDRSLFTKNVRYGLGRTNVNKEISKTINQTDQHKKFLLYHNGITMVAESVTINEVTKELTIKNYSIVNGCQSTLTLYENRDKLSNSLKIELKIVETKQNAQLAEKITFYANNQNPINASDLRSREKFQIDLQTLIKKSYGDKLFYQISRGEAAPGLRVIDKTFVAQLIYSFKEEKPFDVHNKTTVFVNNYNEIFTRHINEHYIYFIDKLFQLITDNLDAIEEQIVRTYLPTRFFILYTIKRIMSKDAKGKQFFVDQKKFLIDYSKTLEAGFNKLIRIIIIYLNHQIASIKDNSDFIEYKNLFRNFTQTKKLADDICSNYEISIIHSTESKLSNLLID